MAAGATTLVFQASSPAVITRVNPGSTTPVRTPDRAALPRGRRRGTRRRSRRRSDGSRPSGVGTGASVDVDATPDLAHALVDRPRSQARLEQKQAQDRLIDAIHVMAKGAETGRLPGALLVVGRPVCRADHSREPRRHIRTGLWAIHHRFVTCRGNQSPGPIPSRPASAHAGRAGRETGQPERPPIYWVVAGAGVRRLGARGWGCLSRRRAAVSSEVWWLWTAFRSAVGR
jgi:hypothetical protein